MTALRNFKGHQDLFEIEKMKRRLFLAIDFPKGIKKEIGIVLSGFKIKYPEVRWEKEENLHLTLKFLGWTEDREKIDLGMGKAVFNVRPFWLQITNVGYFLTGSLVVWLGVEMQDELLKLVDNLENEMAKIGFPKEKRSFTSHITLGRKRQAQPLSFWRVVASDLQKREIHKFEKFKVEKIVLMESHLSSSGSTYTHLRTTGLIL